MQQSECWVEWTFPLSEEQQLAIYCQNLNVFMTANERKGRSTRNTNPSKAAMTPNPNSK